MGPSRHGAGLLVSRTSQLCVCVCVFLSALGKGCGGVQGVSALLIIPASQVSVYCPDSRLRRFACFGAAREIADYEATVKEGVKKKRKKTNRNGNG